MGGSQPDASPAQAALGTDRIRANQNPLDPKYQHVHDPNVSESQLAAEAEAENIRDAQREQQKEGDAKAEKELNAQRTNDHASAPPAPAMGERERGYMASKAALENLDKVLVPENSPTAQAAVPGIVTTPAQLGSQASALKAERDASREATDGGAP